MKSYTSNGYKALFLLIPLTACAIIPAPIGAAAGYLEPGRAVVLVQQPDQSPLQRDAESAVRRMLTVQGYRVVAKADLWIDVSFAKRDTGVGFSSSAIASGAEPVAGEKRAGGVNLCRDSIYRLTVAIADPSSGVLAYRGFAEVVSCHVPAGNELDVLAATALRTLRRIG